jgi:hypothetical protein
VNAARDERNWCNKKMFDHDVKPRLNVDWLQGHLQQQLLSLSDNAGKRKVEKVSSAGAF